MADNFVTNPGVGGLTFRAVDGSSVYWPAGLTAYSAGGVPTLVDATHGIPVQPQTGATWAVTGTFYQATQPVSIAATVTVTGAGGTFPVTDSNSSLTVDAPVGTPVFVRLSDGTSAISTLPVSVASLPLPTGAATSAAQATIISTLSPLNQSAAQDAGSVYQYLLMTGAALDDSDSAYPLLAKTADPSSGDRGIVVRNIPGGTQAVSLASVPTHAVTQSGTWNVGTVTTLTTCATVTNLSQLGGAAIAMGTGTRSAGTQRVTIATDDVVPASQSGTWTVGLSAAQTLATVTTCSTLTGSGVAHDAADSGNPHKIGAKATTALSALTLVADADRTDLRAGIDGVQITRPHCNLEDIVSGVAAITDGSSTSVIAAAGSGVKVHITSVVIRNSSATDVGVDLRDGAAGSVKATFPAPPNGGGCVHHLSVPLPFSANTAVCADPSAAASTVTVTLIGFKSKV